MILELQARLAALPDFVVKTEFYQSSPSAQRVICIEPVESTADIKSGLQPHYAETVQLRLVIGMPAKANPTAVTDLLRVVQQVRALLWQSERSGDRVSWLPCISFLESDSCKFIAPNANETKALAVISLEIKQRIPF